MHTRFLSTIVALLALAPAAAHAQLVVEVSGPHSVVIGNRVPFDVRVTVNGSPIPGAQVVGSLFASSGAEVGSACSAFTDADGIAQCDSVPFNQMGSFLIRFSASLGGLPTAPVDWPFSVTGAPSVVTYTGPTTVDPGSVPTWAARLNSGVECVQGLEPCLRYEFLLEGQPVDFYLDLDNNAFAYLCTGTAAGSSTHGWFASCSGWGAVSVTPGPHTIFARFAGDPFDLPFWGASVAAAPITITQPAPTRPTSKEQCKGEGWRSFPGFRNQGDCVSFVASRGRR